LKAALNSIGKGGAIVLKEKAEVVVLMQNLGYIKA